MRIEDVSLEIKALQKTLNELKDSL